MGMSPGGVPGGGGGGNPISKLLPVIMGALSGRTGSNAGQDFSQQQAQLQGSDPGMLARQMEEVNKVMGVLFVKTFQTLPNVANQISATMKVWSRAMKEIQGAANVGEVVGKSEQQTQAPSPGGAPIDFSAASQGQSSQPDASMTSGGM
jgi:hypothetical protein